MMAILSAFLFAASLPAEPQSVVRDFYAAWAAGDAAAAAKFWTNESAPAFQARAARTFQTRCQVVHDVAIGGMDVDGDVARVAVDSRVTRWSAMPGAAVDIERQRVTLTLRRQDGGWKIERWRTAEEELAEREEAVCERPELHNRRLVKALCQRAMTLVNQGSYERAARTLAIAREIAANLDDPAAHAELLSAESVLLRSPRHADAIACLRTATRAAGLGKESGDADTFARTLMRLSRAHHYAVTGDDLGPAEQSVALAGYVEDASIVAMCASRLAQAYDDGRRPRQGLRYAKLAAEYAAMSGDPAALMNASMNLSGALELRNDARLALLHAQKALEQAERAGFPAAQGGALVRIARLEQELGNHERVLPLLDRAAAAHGPSGDAVQHAEVLDRKFDYFVDRGEFAAAEAALRESARLRGCHLGDGGCVGVQFAWLRFHQGRLDEALATAEQADDPHPRAAILRAMGRTSEAREEYERAIRRHEDERRQLDHTLHRTFRSPDEIFIELMELHVDEGQPQQALGVAQRMKARVLRELIAAQGDPAGEGGDVATLNERLEALNRRLLAIQHAGGDTTHIRAELRHARGALDQALAFRDTPRAPALDAPPVDPASIRAPDEMTVVEYVVGSKRTLAFVIRGTDVKTHTIDAGEDEVRTMVRELMHAVELRDAKYRPLARRAYDLLLRPLLGATPREPLLCVIPHDALWTLPFQALVSAEGKHLIEHVPLFYAPSLSMLPRTPAPRRERPTVLAFGDPALDFDTRLHVRADHRDATLGRLPDARREVDALRHFYGSRVETRTGAVAAESALKRNAGRYDVLHFATHGLVDDYSAMYSALLLAGSENEDGLLEAREILSLPLRADLVVLSACNSARGPVTGSEGVLGLSWAFLATGCPRTVATQWGVGSAAAARLMIEFHERLSKQPAVMRVADALRGAQLEVLRDRRYRHPYYWAGFVLIGREY